MQISTDTSLREAYSRDTSLFAVVPQGVAQPRNSADIGELVRQASQTPGLSLTARSGGTDMTGGPLTTSVVVDMTKHFTKLANPVNNTISVQPGVYYRDLAKHLTPYNLLLPSYPASKDICTLGGMVANNSGGEKSLIYGKTADYVQELQVILSDGEEYTLRSLNRAELEKKMNQKNFEGESYRRVFQLLDKNYEAIQQAKPRVSKNSAGYALWDVWNRDTGIFDLTRLFSGSQGTLGIITSIVFRLVSPAPNSQMLVVFMRDLAPLAAIVRAVLTYHPETFESYDDHTLKLAVRFLPDLWRKMPAKNLFSLLISFLPELKMIITGGSPKLVLLAEFTGHNRQEIEKRARACQALLKNFPVQTRLARTEQEVSKFWTIRRESFNLLRQHVHGKRTAPFIDDIIVRPEVLPEFLPRLDEIISQYDITYTIAGHVGDANFHIIPLMNPARPDFVDIIKKLSEEVYELVLEYNGSITAEHNDGLIRSHYLKTMFGEDVYNLFVETKKIFDPQNIFNPGKKVNADWIFAQRHLIKTLD